MKVFENVLETIGNTPMIRLHKVCDEIAATVYAKVEQDYKRPSLYCACKS